MGDKKHIDRIFQEKLKDFEVFPDAEVWKNIEEQLVKKKKRRVVPLWLRFGGVAATLLMLVSGGIWYYNSVEKAPKTPDTNTIITDVDTDEQQNKLKNNKEYPSVKNSEINSKKSEENTVAPIQKGTIQLKSKNTTRFANTSSDKQQEKQKEHLKKNILKTFKQKGEIATKTEEKSDAVTVKETNNAIALSDREKNASDTDTMEAVTKTETTIASNTTTNNTLKSDGKKDINEALKQDDKSIALLEKEASSDKKWSVGSTVAPVFFNTLKEGSPIHSALASNEKTSRPSLSYGLKVSYKINKRLSLQSGVNSLELGYQTKGVSAQVTSNSGFSNNTNIDTNIQGIKIVTVSNNDNTIVQSQELATSRFDNGGTKLSGDLNQSFSYIEFPVEAKYNLLQRKVGVHIIGGMSTYILYDNAVSLESQNSSTSLGEGSNINNMNFSGNVGVDVDYSINEKLYINVSPMFKYQFNTFSENDGGFTPYSLGIYTGLNFRF